MDFQAQKLKMHYSNQKLIVLVFQKKKENNKIIKWDLIKNNNKKFNFKINWIIHTAAIHKIIDFSKKPNNNKKNNILMSKNLIRFAKKNMIKNIIFFSTIDLSYNNISGIKKDYNISKLKSEEIFLKAYKKDF